MTGTTVVLETVTDQTPVIVPNPTPAYRPVAITPEKILQSIWDEDPAYDDMDDF